MGNLHVTKFRVLNYRNIDDSEWIPVEQVTSFVGRNESGKTALLKALHKFNPAMPEPYKAQREFPRDRFSAQYDDGAHWAVCEVDFTLSQDLRERLSQGWDKAEPPVSVVCTRYYDGSLSFRCEPKIGDSSIPADSLREALGEFAKGARRLATEDPEQEEKTQAIRTGLANWATNWNDTVKGLTDLRSDSGVQTLQKIKTEVETKSQPLTADLVDAIQAVIGKLLEETTSPTRKEILDKIIKESLPVFIYFENYGILDSAVYLPRLLEDLEKTPHDAKVRTVNALFKHVGLTAQEIADLGRSEASEARLKDENVTQKMIQRDQERKELRAVKLNSASIDITQRFAKWWQQRRHKIRYDVDGDYFRVWVSDD